MKASTVIDRVSKILSDVSNVRWAVAELVDYINDAQLQVVSIDPKANTLHASMRLAAGAKQSIPDGSAVERSIGYGGAELPQGIEFISMTHNLMSDGVTAGRGIIGSDILSMNSIHPDWRAEERRHKEGRAVEIFMNGADKKTFFVYPKIPSVPAIYAEVCYSAVPKAALVSDLSEPVEPDLALSDEYLAPVCDWVLFRCFSKDAEEANSAARAEMHINAFKAVLTKG